MKENCLKLNMYISKIDMNRKKRESSLKSGNERKESKVKYIHFYEGKKRSLKSLKFL
jgi:hypothetical protein